MDPVTNAPFVDPTSAIIELIDSRLGLADLGIAYLLLIAHAVLTLCLYASSRAHLVVTPNLAARHYGLHVAAVMATLVVATVLDNELSGSGAALLSYAMLPQIVVVGLLHLGIYRSADPRLIALGGATSAGLVLIAVLAAVGGAAVGLVHWVTALLLIALLGLLWHGSVSTKRGFINARSIYLDSKEQRDDGRRATARAWLSSMHWIGLTVASVALAFANALLRGAGPGDVPAAALVVEAAMLLGITSLVCVAPAAGYWYLRRDAIPDLTRFAWLTWLIVAFAFTYGNYLTRISLG